MPVSATVFDQHVTALIQLMKPASVLDIGPGAGKYGAIIKLLREHGLLLLQPAIAQHEQAATNDDQPNRNQAIPSSLPHHGGGRHNHRLRDAS